MKDETRMFAGRLHPSSFLFILEMLWVLGVRRARCALQMLFAADVSQTPPDELGKDLLV